MKNIINSLFQDFVDELVSLDEISVETNYVPYGDTYVKCCKTISDEDIELAKKRFVEYIKENVETILEENDIDKTTENKKLFIKLAKEV